MTEGFHITITDHQKKYFQFCKGGARSLMLLPFEFYHQKNFNLPVKKQPYRFPENTFFPLCETEYIKPLTFIHKQPEIKTSVSRVEYIRTVMEIKAHIQRGDIYEMNFCFEFFAENAAIDPFAVFEKLYDRSKAPFSSLTHIDGLYILCCSPERFLKKTGDVILSQPMKGTAPRNTDAVIDENNKIRLQQNLKEKTENVMIVDLVRNDLSKIARRGTVKTENLFEVQSFATVHQMISTVQCLNDNHTTEEILEAAFPMGSMTGAPKKRALELIGKYEKKARGMYSGTIGILEPDGDFDLAVIIRSIVYDSKNKYLSFSVGSAITAACDPEQEYEECLLKAQTMMGVFKA